MADDWELHAVVGGRAAAIPIENHVNNPEDLLPELASANLTNDHDPFYHLGIHENKSYQFPGLEEIYRKFNSQPEPICSSFSLPVLGGLIGNQQQIQMVTPPPQQRTEQQQIQPQFQISRDRSSLTLPNQPSQTVRPRKRKNQQKKSVHQMTHKELLADSWAWRKYGQKPIKGSPYPRNYYRCSSSKGCLARKQVEISPSDPNIYVVSYTGEHTHPRPTHRNSLAGSSRNKFSGARSSQSSSDHQGPSAAAAAPNPSCSSSSPISSSSFSPGTPLMEGESAHDEIARRETMEIQNDDETEGNGSENDEDLLIPNMVMSEDILKGFQELRQGFSTP